MNIEYFGNDKYRVLTYMKKRQIFVIDSAIIKLSQQEIADILQLRKVNAIISELKNDGCIIRASPRGKYSITEKATEAFAIIHSSDY